MSKLSFRARNIDYTKRMPVFLAENLPDVSEYAAINRSVPQMPSGMEKEEENEYHLQQAITARQASAVGAAKPCPPEAVIPIPKVETDVNIYADLYADCYKPPKQLIRVQAALSLEPEYPDYDLDDEDERWINYICEQLKLDITPLEFERIMDTLEKQSEYKVISAEDAKLLLQADDDIIFAVYDYWLNKRFNYTSQGRKLIPRVRGERRCDAQAPLVADPYVGFRRRAEKMQTRKNRKNDEESYEKILKLRNDLQKALTLLEMVKRREKSKRELIKLGFDLAQKRLDLKDYNSEIYNQLKQDVKPMFQFSKEEMLIGKSRKQAAVKRRKIKEDKDIVSREYLLENAEQWYKPALFPSTSLSSPPYTYNSLLSPSSNSRLSCYADLADKHLPGTKGSTEPPIDGPYALKRKKGCLYLAPTSSGSFDSGVDDGRRCCWPWEQRRPQFRYANCYLNSRSTMLTQDGDNVTIDSVNLSSSPHLSSLRYMGLCRRRLGRGGRVVIDRVSSFKDLRIINRSTSTVDNVDQPSTSKQEILHKHYPKTKIQDGHLKSRIPFYYPSSRLSLYNGSDLISDSEQQQHIFDDNELLLSSSNWIYTHNPNEDDATFVKSVAASESSTKSFNNSLISFVLPPPSRGDQNQSKNYYNYNNNCRKSAAKLLNFNFKVDSSTLDLNVQALSNKNDSIGSSKTDDLLDASNDKLENRNIERKRSKTGNLNDDDEEKDDADDVGKPPSPLDTRRIFEATAAVMTSSQMLQLTERYERAPPPTAAAADDGGGSGGGAADGERSPNSPVPSHCAAHFGTFGSTNNNNTLPSLRRENGFLSC